MLWIQENLRGLLDPIVEGYTTLGNTGLMWIVLSLAMLCWKPTRKAGVAALAAMVLGLWQPDLLRELIDQIATL